MQSKKLIIVSAVISIYKSQNLSVVSFTKYVTNIAALYDYPLAHMYTQSGLPGA